MITIKVKIKILEIDILIQLFMPYRNRDRYLIMQKKGEIDMAEKSNTNTVFVQVVERPDRKLILKRGIKAENYYEYCGEVDCNIWGMLVSIKEAMYEPIVMWMPNNMIKPGTSKYAQGVEVPIDYKGEVSAGFDIVDLKTCKMMVFQGEPYENEKFEEAIGELWTVMKKYNPEIYGFEWAVEGVIGKCHEAICVE
jgi:AraC family transcriptional regulator